MRTLCWFRRDLRLHDSTALAHATTVGTVFPLFVFDRRILDDLEDRDDRRVTFIHDAVAEMDRGLRARGSRMIVAHGDPVTLVPELARRLRVDRVVTARDFEPYAIERDAAVESALREQGIGFETVRDHVVREKGEVLAGSGLPYRIFTPYARTWRAVFEFDRDAAERFPDLGRLAPSSELPAQTELEPIETLGFRRATLWTPSGARAGRERLHEFRQRMARYGERRDFPAQEGTSGLSVHLRFGTVCVRECVREALSLEGPGADKWLTELIWRDFYADILAWNPRVVHEPFQKAYRDVVYPGDPAHLEAWKEGRTGYPLVDAAMRSLNGTGFMHNRLRMVVASFLTKDLLIDYRHGEAYFARRLLDFDLASNNGGWQWAASTGCDPQPYFRIFNPITQSEKFDPEGAFIRRWCPDLGELDAKAIHFPARAEPMVRLAAGVELGRTYPWPIVDHTEMRPKAIALLASATKAPIPSPPDA